MSENFSTVRIADPRISTITNKSEVGVYSSGSEITVQNYNATSFSNNSWVFTCPIPSPSIIIDREAYIAAQVYFTVSLKGVAVNAYAYQCGQDAFQAFPLNQIFQNSSCTINNSNISLASSQIIPHLIQLEKPEVLCKYNLETPCYPDKSYLYYKNAVGTSNNPLSGYPTSGFDDINYGRGATPIQILSVVHTVYDNNNAAGAVNTSLISTNLNDTFVIGFTATLYEPLMNLSPFIFNPTSKNNAGIYGVSQMNFNFSIDSTLARFWSSGIVLANGAGGGVANYTISQGVAGQNQNNMFSNVSLRFTFLTAQPSDLLRIPNKNIVPYNNYTLYLNNSGKSFIPANVASMTQTLSSNTISLSVVPDLLLIYVKIPQALMTSQVSTGYFTINSINITYNNKSGIFSNYNSMDLYRISQKNGLQMSWFDWSGHARTQITQPGGLFANYQAMNDNNTVNTLGSLLVVNPIDFGLPDVISSGSQYMATLRFDINVSSNYSVGRYYGTTDNNLQITPDICCISIESGQLITEAMQSSLEIGLLNKEMVLNAKDSPVHIDDLEVQAGGSMSNKMRTNLQHHHKKHHHLKAGSMSAGSDSGGHRKHALSKYY